MLQGFIKSAQLIHALFGRRLVPFLALSALLALADLVGIFSVIPFLGIIVNREVIHSSSKLSWLYSQSGVQSVDHFILLLASVLVVFFWMSGIVSVVVMRKGFGLSSEIMHYLTVNVVEDFCSSGRINWRNISRHELNRLLTFEIPQITMHVMIPLLQIAGRFLAITLIIGALLFIHTAATVLVIGLVGGLYLSATFVVKSKTRVLGDMRRQATSERDEAISSLVHGFKEVTSHNLIGSTVRKIHRSSRDIAGVLTRQNTISATPKTLIEVSGLTILVVTGTGSVLSGYGTQELLGFLFACAVLFQRVLPAFQALYSCVSHMQFQGPTIIRLFEITQRVVRRPPVPEEPQNETERRDRMVFESLSLDGVSFCYPNDAEVFKNVTFTIRQGSKVALMGKSGAGKSTLTDLILKILQPTSGQIRLNGVVANEVPDSAWREVIAYLPQEVLLLNGSLERNVVFNPDRNAGRPEGVVAAADFAGVPAHLRHAANLMTSTDTGLSGGERQRIGIARMHFRNAEFWILDESTSALDPQAERELISKIIASRRTVLFITHKPEVAAMFDKILVLADGVLKEVGPSGFAEAQLYSPAG